MGINPLRPTQGLKRATQGLATDDNFIPRQLSLGNLAPPRFPPDLEGIHTWYTPIRLPLKTNEFLWDWSGPRIDQGFGPTVERWTHRMISALIKRQSLPILKAGILFSLSSL